MRKLRLDYLASVHVVSPTMRLLNRKGATGIPILMYHSVSGGPPSARHPYYQTHTSPRTFREHLAYLRNNRYDVIDLETAGEIVGGNASHTGRPVVLTFDDGFRDFFTEAWPLLAEHGVSATVFLPTDYIGDTRKALMQRECMTWDEVRALSREGIRFGSHTVTHPQLHEQSREDIVVEIRRSRQVVEDRLGCPVQSFAYPFAFPESDRAFTGFLRETLVKEGIRYGVTTILGTAGKGDDVLFLKRLPINDYDDPKLLRAKLEGGYDWLHAFQYVAKRLRKY